MKKDIIMGVNFSESLRLLVEFIEQAEEIVKKSRENVNKQAKEMYNWSNSQQLWD